MQLDGELAFVLPTESSQVQIHLQSKQTRAKGFIPRFIDFLFPLASESGVDWSNSNFFGLRQPVQKLTRFLRSTKQVLA